MWNVDASNPVGAEYMIMEKIRGISPHGDEWESLPIGVKLNVIRQVARDLAVLFSLRFRQAGSLYLPTDGKADHLRTGPIVSLPFYRAFDGILEYPGMSPATLEALNSLRGPFNTTFEYLASYLRAKLFKIENFRDSIFETSDGDVENRIKNARRIIELGLELCQSYPGNHPIPSSIGNPSKPFALRLQDFRLTNVLIDAKTGQINGYIDFEGTTVAPLWLCATVPEWIPDPDGDMADWYGGTPEEQRELWLVFHTTMDQLDQTLTGGEWRKAFEQGKQFRNFASRLALHIPCWDNLEMEKYVQDALMWSKEHPGVGMPVDDMTFHSMR
ncbi:hypothetical protein RhiJN_18428 [Ceratobasidium sp. AG-Ba]|nr:hypothetical protein RhiJN_18428 [Ceratobasidium sp. AG-Ba]